MGQLKTFRSKAGRRGEKSGECEQSSRNHGDCAKLEALCLCGHGCKCELASTTENDDDPSVVVEYCLPIPWQTSHTIPGPPPKTLLWTRDDVFLEAALLGDCDHLEACIARGVLFSVIRDVQGGTALHLAVLSGSLDAVTILLGAGAYINATDWMDRSPLFYACDSPGQEDIYLRQPSWRAAMVEFLVRAGADTSQPDVSGVKPWEAANQHGYLEVSCCITTSIQHREFTCIHDQIHTRTFSAQSARLIDLMWRERTASWLIRYNRAATMRQFRPHAELAHATEPEQVETFFQDCRKIHKMWWNNLH